jgi:hypothetical protein
MNNFKLVSRHETSEFNSNSENRVINHAHVNRIKGQMKISLNVMQPITINEITKNVIDGQHRLKAFQKLVDDGELSADSKLAVMYVRIKPSDEKEAIINANTNSKNWSLDDYIASYAKSVSYYKQLDEWCGNHALTVDGNKKKYRYGAAILTGVACSKQLKDGSFSLTLEDFARGEEVHSELLEIIEILGKPNKGNYLEYMAVSWCQIRGKYPFREWLKELKTKKGTLNKKPFSNKQDWDNIFSLLLRAISIKSE